MKTLIKKIAGRWYMLLIGLMLVPSCKKDYFYDDINVDPSELQDPAPSSLVPGIILSTGYNWGGDASRFSSIFMQQVTGAANQSVLANNYAVSSDDVDNMWTAGLYGGGIMNNANALINIATRENQLHYAALGQVMMAFNLGLATDVWGDVPYTQAFKGIENTQPTYDTQEQIYASIDQLLTSAITSLGTEEESPFQPGSEDLLFGGDLEQWLRFAHSLRAKFFLHLAKRDRANYDRALTEAALGFLPGENAEVRFAGTSVTSENPWYQFNTQRADIGFTGNIYDMMAAASDPRLAVYSDGAEGLGTLYGSNNSSVFLMSYDELKFIEAECHLQKSASDAGAAATAYNEGVRANLSRTISNESYAATIAKTGANITLADVMTQKYIALFLSPEVWTDWRRTGYPTLVAPEGSSLGGELPRSLPYPSGEQRYNVNAPRNTSLLRRVWWDVE
ncbi:SusD/RagB family nutrient-binding outer membrane lipoprotein [Pedobacter immunditicola]|uniref:SusD/RagB family nutrient-binding outer membrane lipoprotein n=1 Tax=Pedobacter immunditicola TaxID=3133440 RepID=UPI0030B3D5EC